LLSQIQMTNSVATSKQSSITQQAPSISSPAPSDFSSSVLHNHKLKYYLQTETSKKK